MAKRFAIIWTRLNGYTDIWYNKYTRVSLPKFLALEGNGIQYYCAFPRNELESIINEMKQDGHEFSSHQNYEQLIEHEQTIEDPKDYKINLQYRIDNGKYSKNLFLDKIKK